VSPSGLQSGAIVSGDPSSVDPLFRHHLQGATDAA